MIVWLIQWKGLLGWLLITAITGGYLTHLHRTADDKTPLLPGKTTHGHYQIEMECATCHTDEPKENLFTSSGVSNAACNACHGQSLSDFSDSHPTRKFKNPENAIFLQHIDALNCVTCHREHNAKITRSMGVTIPQDYCAHCHQVTLENLESHKNLPFNSCATAGCHNFHDNMALSPSFLLKHYGEPAIKPEPTSLEVNALARWLEEGHSARTTLTHLDQADAPADQLENDTINADWLSSRHATAGINCSDCHQPKGHSEWIARPDLNSCRDCHQTEITDFQQGKHGMRTAHPGLSPMRPGMARKAMKPENAHQELSCNSCHQSHRYDRQFAAQAACIQCHDDTHTQNYPHSAHARLWNHELAGILPSQGGVSCASCHLPRETRSGQVVVNHDQNANLTPNEKMMRNVCLRCHGLQFSMDALSDPSVILSNFSQAPSKHHPGLDWAAEAAIARDDERIIRIKAYLDGLDASPSPPEENK